MGKFWAWLWCLLGLSLAAPHAMDADELSAKQYLHACINAVASLSLSTSSAQGSAWQGKTCDDPAFGLERSADQPIPKTAVKSSLVTFGPRWPQESLEDFEVSVTDQKNRTWKGSLSHYPKLPPRPLSPVQLAAARQSALETLAQNYARQCFGYTYGLQTQEIAALDGKSCAAIPALNKRADPNDLPQSVIHARPDTADGVQVEVTSASGKIYRLPPQVTLLPVPEPPIKPWVHVVRWALVMLGIAVALAFLAFLFGGHPWLARIGLMLSFPAVVLLWGIWHDPPPIEALGYIAFWLFTWLLLGVLGALPRLAYRFEHERWWEALGNSLFWALLLSPWVAVYIFFDIESVSAAQQRSLWALGLISLALSVWGWLGRRRASAA
ncbi:hypothetical protein Dxin01_00963 [Deinococcus xinjiangensis]|uniref:Uncharacterized protein n=1 Tax=Deinococcus xinjiangensis TaxID=457454 RepID=A0ABP9V9F8_9DEIO